MKRRNPMTNLLAEKSSRFEASFLEGDGAGETRKSAKSLQAGLRSDAHTYFLRWLLGSSFAP